MNAGAEYRFVTIQHLTQPKGKLCTPLWDDVTAFEEEAPDLVHQGGAVSDKLVTDTMERLHVELLLGL